LVIHAYNAAETRRPFMPVIKSEKLKQNTKGWRQRIDILQNVEKMILKSDTSRWSSHNN